MAAAIFNRLADSAKARAISAGTSPAGTTRPFLEYVQTL